MTGSAALATIMFALSTIVPSVRAGSQALAGPQSTASPARPLDDLSRIGLRYTYDNVTAIDDWHDVSLSLSRRSPLGTVTAAINGARRYGKNGVQVELQAYPRLTPRSYVALDGAWSGSKDVFVPLRLSVEPYYNFVNGWETSLGIRYFHSAAADVIVYTGTLGRYFGSYWISGRPHFSRGSDESSYGWQVTTRRYFEDRYDYLSLLVGRSLGVAGDAADPQRLGRGIGSSAVVVRIERRQPLRLSGLRATYGAGYERERIGAGNTRQHRMGTIGLEWFVR